MSGKVADSVQPLLIALSRMPLCRFKRKMPIAQMGWIQKKIGGTRSDLDLVDNFNSIDTHQRLSKIFILINKVFLELLEAK